MMGDVARRVVRECRYMGPFWTAAAVLIVLAMGAVLCGIALGVVTGDAVVMLKLGVAGQVIALLAMLMLFGVKL